MRKTDHSPYTRRAFSAVVRNTSSAEMPRSWAFEAHIRLALELDKPIIVHDRNAHADVYALLKKYQPKGIVHCYSGSADDAVWLAKQGLFIGFGGA